MSSDTKNNSFAPVKELQWLFFDLNSYFASVEQQDRPELRNKPIAIVPSDTDATCAIAASYEAKAFGIKTGTKIYDAKKLCERRKQMSEHTINPSGEFLNQYELSKRWKISPRTLERWRWLGSGPRYHKIGGRVVYKLCDVETFETDRSFTSTMDEQQGGAA